uniref:Extended-spectrum beta-lactamase n=1 Tax=Escherichia coli TaxID=562 RepID=A0A7I8HMX8_ECOLX|nr:extended-spectrum beta-lactamase [Escherichia coli]
MQPHCCRVILLESVILQCNLILCPCYLYSNCGKARQWDDVTGCAYRGRATVQRYRGAASADCSRWRTGSRHRVLPTAGRLNVPSRPYRTDDTHRHSGRSVLYHFASGRVKHCAASVTMPRIAIANLFDVDSITKHHLGSQFPNAQIPFCFLFFIKPGGGGWGLLSVPPRF